MDNKGKKVLEEAGLLYPTPNCVEYYQIVKATADEVVQRIFEAMSDSVQVVRCKDCKWYEIEQLKRDGTDDKRYKPSVCVRGSYAEPRKADWYCADGERREDA